MNYCIFAFFIGLIAPPRAWSSPRPLDDELLDGDEFSITKGPPAIHARQNDVQFVSTCGFQDGDEDKPWIGNEGWYCAVDAEYSQWDFCPTGIQEMTDCPVARACVDNHDCETGCDGDDMTTTLFCTDTDDDFCNLGFMTADGETYSRVACDNRYDYITYSAAPAFASAFLSNLASNASPYTSSLSPSRPRPTTSAYSSNGTATTAASDTSTASTRPLANSPTAEVNGHQPKTGIIVGGVVGGLCGLALLGAIAVLLRRRYAGDNFKNLKFVFGAKRPPVPTYAPVVNSQPASEPPILQQPEYIPENRSTAHERSIWARRGRR